MKVTYIAQKVQFPLQQPFQARFTEQKKIFNSECSTNQSRDFMDSSFPYLQIFFILNSTIFPVVF